MGKSVRLAPWKDDRTTYRPARPRGVDGLRVPGLGTGKKYNYLSSLATRSLNLGTK